MSSQEDVNSAVYSFETYRLDVAKCILYDVNGIALPLKTKAFETLLYLVRNPGRMIARDEIMAAVWQGTVVEENNLTQHISSLRRVLGEKKDEHRFIITVPGHGYKFAAAVDLQNTSTSPAPHSNDVASIFRYRLVFVGLGVAVALLLLGVFYQRGALSEPEHQITSLAILPFRPISEADRNTSFENALTNELITRLERSEGLRVRSFQAVRRFSSGELDPVYAGLELNVEAVLDTTVQFSERRVRISVKLIKVQGAQSIWSQSFDDDRTDLILLQDDLTERVANALKVKLSESANKHYTSNSEAYELYLQGQSHLMILEPGEVRLGIAKFEQAIGIDPSYALAYSGIAKGYLSLALSSELPPHDMAERSFAAAEKAVELDPQLAEGYATLGAANFWFRHDWKAAESALKRAIDLETNSAFAHLYYAVLLGNMGRIDDALVESKKARELDEFSAYSTSMQGTTLVHAGRPLDALIRFGEAMRLNPRLWTPHCKAALAKIDLQQYDEAVAAAQRATELNGKQTNSAAYEAYALSKLGRRAEAQTILQDLLARSNKSYVPPYHIAVVYAGLGDRRNALTWLERAFVEGDPKIVFIRSEHFWKEYRSEPRYLELLRKMKLDIGF